MKFSDGISNLERERERESKEEAAYIYLATGHIIASNFCVSRPNGGAVGRIASQRA
jgi:hypothetical protein